MPGGLCPRPLKGRVSVPELAQASVTPGNGEGPASLPGGLGHEQTPPRQVCLLIEVSQGAERSCQKHSGQSLSPRGPLSQSLAGTDKSLTQSEFNKGEGTCRKPHDRLRSPEPPQTSLPCPKLPERTCSSSQRTHSRRTAPRAPPWGLGWRGGAQGWLWLLSCAPVQDPPLLRPALPIRLKPMGGNLLAVCGPQSRAGQSADHGNWNILGK